MRVEGGGNNALPSFVLDGDALVKRADKLCADFDKVLDGIEWKNKDVPSVITAVLNLDALAKSHRGKINTLFSGNRKNNIIGLCDEKTIKIMVSGEEEASEIKNRITQPQKYAYEISCIEEIGEFKPTIVKSSTIDDYKIKLINFQNYAQNKVYARRFENYLIEKQIEYKKTKYSPDLYVYKLKKADSAVVDSLMNSDIFDLTEEIVPMPKVFLDLDSIETGNEFPVMYPKDFETYAIVGVLDNGIERNKYLEPWIAGTASPYPKNVITPSHGTKIASIITYGDKLDGREYVGNCHVKVFDATVFPDTNKESFDEDDLIANVQEIVRSYCKDIKIWNLSISITREINPDSFSDFAVALDSLQDECNVLICKSTGNCRNFAFRNPVGHLHEGADSVRSLVVGSIAQSSEREERIFLKRILRLHLRELGQVQHILLSRI